MTSMKDKTKGKPQYGLSSQQIALMKVIGFTEDDLDANRDGYMSKKQRGALSRERQQWLKFIAIIIGGTSVLYTLFLLKSIIRGDQFPDNILIIAFICLAAALMSMYMGFKRSRVNADLRKGDVYIAEGLISLYIQKIQNGQLVFYIYHADIQQQRFKLEKTVYDAFVNGEPYAIYYAPNSKTILSAEWLRPE